MNLESMILTTLFIHNLEVTPQMNIKRKQNINFSF